MPTQTESEITALKNICIILIKTTRDALARAETLRTLLVSRGAISQAEHESDHSQALQEFDRAIDTLIQEKAKVANDAAIRRLLESFQGRVQ